MMKSSLSLTLMVLAVVVGQAWAGLLQCKRLDEPCLPLPLNCCRGLYCKRNNLGGGLRCQQGQGLLGRCLTRGHLCTPDFGNNPCCRGMVCRPRVLNPIIHECV